MPPHNSGQVVALESVVGGSLAPGVTDHEIHEDIEEELVGPVALEDFEETLEVELV